MRDKNPMCVPAIKDTDKCCATSPVQAVICPFHLDQVMWASKKITPSICSTTPLRQRLCAQMLREREYRGPEKGDSAHSQVPCLASGRLASQTDHARLSDRCDRLLPLFQCIASHRAANYAVADHALFVLHASNESFTFTTPRILETNPCAFSRSLSQHVEKSSHSVTRFTISRRSVK